MLRFRRAPKPCPSCREPKVLAFYDTKRRPACAACTGNHPFYACPECGREDSPFGRKCGPCTLRDRVSELLDDGNGRIHPRLQPVFDTLTTGPRPQTTLYWLTRASSRPDILRRMARGELEISHTTFKQLPTDRSVNYLRDLLAAVGVLPAYHPPLERITPWLKDILQPLPKHHADLVDRFARWHVLRKLRTQTRTATPTQKGAERARAAILTSVRLLSWLDDHGLALPSMTQADLEHYLTSHPTRAEPVTAFLDWTNRSGLTNDLTVPTPSRALPLITVSDDDRWRHIEQLLHDDTIRTYTRIAGLLMLLFAQPLSRICRMRADQITTHPDGRVTVTFDTVPIELPEPLDQLVRQQLTNRGQASYVSRADNWLSPAESPADTSSPRTSAANSSNTESDPVRSARPQCSSSPPRSPLRSSPTSSASARPQPCAGRHSRPATGASTPPCAAPPPNKPHFEYDRCANTNRSPRPSSSPSTGSSC
jgi:hypothetical protein